MKRRRSYENLDSEEEYSDQDYIYSEVITKISKKKDKKMLLEVKKFIKKTEPNVENILREPLKIEDKAYLIRLCEIYFNEEESVNKIELCKKINSLFEKYKEDYYLKENINISSIEEKTFNKKIINLNTTSENKEIIYRKYNEMINISPSEIEYMKLKTWLDWAITLPYDNLKLYSDNDINLYNFKKKMDKELYGMNNVKEKLLLFLHSKISNPNMKNCSLGLLGPPGVGKTRISRLISDFLDFPFEQISFGGVSKVDFIKGHPYTYIGSEPGIITKKIRNMKYKNGIIFIDEYEKVLNSSELNAAMLHITDPSQNMEYQDIYLGDIKQDLSCIWFIYSMNSLPKDSALRDRMFIINVNGYNKQEKKQIIKDYILPKALININRQKNDIIFDNKTINILIEQFQNDDNSGVRKLEQIIHDICNKIDFLINYKNNIDDFNLKFNIKNLKYPIKINSNMINKLL